MSDRVETRVPLNINDEGLEAPDSILPRPITLCTTYSAIIAHCEFVKIANQIHSSFFTFRGLRPSRDLIRGLDDRMLAWNKSLPSCFSLGTQVPSWFDEPRAIILWKGLNFRMLMHKCFLPLLKNHNVKADALEGAAPHKHGAGLCLSLAIQTIDSVHTFVFSHTLRRGIAWYCTYFAFQAALVLAIATLTVDETTPPAVWTRNILLAEDCLGAASRCLGDGAGRYLVVLQRVMSIWGGRGVAHHRHQGSSAPPPSAFNVFPAHASMLPPPPPSSTSLLLADCASDGFGFAELGPMPVGTAELPDDYGLSPWMPTAQDFLEGSAENYVLSHTEAMV
ncbi:hypothetical protein L873DRAFT_1697636 [Choiromyces venosus 120613-1]|uniref:Transcription factor domain-containing protein n=1 Tax=Choiromyces venosus 120613-1 TaxID=1336337 RepID=A0A3N4JBK3_9PEZI|nr:hypothetical protein L873DRAFT_1697636 [Choiromyces venosus 120613-1]